MNNKKYKYEYVAVYGSLKKGFHNHNLMKNSEFIGAGITEPKFSMINLGSFPGLHIGSDKILVEVYRVDVENDLPRLDALEGHPDWYRRTLETIILTDGLVVGAWLYTFCNNSSQTQHNPIVKPTIVSW